jgi:hypothetical protein
MKTYCEQYIFSSGCNVWRLQGDYIDSGNNWNNNLMRSILQYNFEVTADQGELSFDVQVSAEERYDYLIFQLDDINMWSYSNRMWTRVAHAIGKGFHKARWIYQKDGSDSRGEDMAKIRMISLAGGNEISISCSHCPPGQFSNGSEPCQACSANTYSDQPGTVACTPCPPSFTSVAGSTQCFLANVPCNITDYYSYTTECNGNDQQDLVYVWIQPQNCNASHPNSVSLPSTVARSCVQPVCKPGQSIVVNKKSCTNCGLGFYSATGGVCSPCPSGTASSSLVQYYDTFTGPWPSNFTTGCKGECRSIGWRRAGSYIDSGVFNGESDSYFELSFDIADTRNVVPRNRSVAFDYSLSCTDGSLQFSIDGYLVQTVVCGGCSDLTKSNSLSLNYITPGRHVLNVNLRTLSVNSQKDTYKCSRAIVRQIAIHSSKTGGAAACQLCTKGEYADNVQGLCESCPAGQKSDQDGANSCTTCQANTFAPGNSTMCYPCGQGTISKQGAGLCEYEHGLCQFRLVSSNRSIDFRQLGRLTSNITAEANAEQGSTFHLNLCGDNQHCNAIGAKACKYIESIDEWINLGSDVSISYVQTLLETGLSLTLTNYQNLCTNNRTGKTGPVKTQVNLICNAEKDASLLGPIITRINNCDYEYYVYDQGACPTCQLDDFKQVEGECDPNTLKQPIQYVKKAIRCLGGDDKTNTVTYVDCVVPQHVEIWIPVTIVIVVLVLLAVVSAVAIVLYFKYRDISMKFNRLQEEETDTAASL